MANYSDIGDFFQRVVPYFQRIVPNVAGYRDSVSSLQGLRVLSREW